MNISDLTKKVYFDMQKFMYTNNIVVTASGFAIGMVTKELIEKVLAIIVFPILNYIKHSTNTRLSWRFLSIPLEIFWSLAIWIVTIVFTFLLLEYFLNKNIFGMVSMLKNEDEDNFVKSKIEARAVNIIPNSEDGYVKNMIEKNNKIIEVAKVMKSNNEDVNIKNGKNADTINNIINSELGEFFEPFL